MALTREVVAALIKRRDQKKTARSNFESLWEEVSKFVHHVRGDFIARKTGGTARTQFIFDATPVWSNEQLASAIQSYLTPAEDPWFDYITKNPALRDDEESIIWLQDTTERQRFVYNSSQSNFNNQIHEGYLDLTSFGTGCIYQEFNGRNTRYYTRHLAEILVDENAVGIVDTVYRTFEMTVRQMIQEFKEENLAPELKRLLNQNREKVMDEKREILHVTMPRVDFNANAAYALDQVLYRSYRGGNDVGIDIESEAMHSHRILNFFLTV